jgi:hypothetical protein
MKKGKKTSKTSILLFLLGVLVLFLLIGSLKEGQTNAGICPIGFKLSLNDPNICCNGKNGYVSQNDKTKCCQSDTIIENGQCKSTRNRFNVFTTTQRPVDASSIILPPPTTEPTNDEKKKLFQTIDTNKDNSLSKDEVYTWGYNTYGNSTTRELSDSRFDEKDINPKDGYLLPNEFK